MGSAPNFSPETPETKNKLTLSNIIIGVAIAALIGLIVFLLLNKSTPPEKQPDTVHKKPDYVHWIKPEKGHFDWEITIQEGKFTVKTGGGNPGDNFDDERFWRPRLDQLIAYLVYLRDNDLFFDENEIDQVNGWVLKEIFAICVRFNIDIHKILIQALGENYTIYIIFNQQGSVIIPSPLLLDTKEVSLEQIIKDTREVLAPRGLKFVGCLKVVGSTVPKFIEYVDYKKDIAREVWEELMESIRDFFVRPKVPKKPPSSSDFEKPSDS